MAKPYVPWINVFAFLFFGGLALMIYFSPSSLPKTIPVAICSGCSLLNLGVIILRVRG